MPKKGYKSITVTNKMHAQLQDIAETEGLSVPKLVRVMLVACYPEDLPPEIEVAELLNRFTDVEEES